MQGQPLSRRAVIWYMYLLLLTHSDFLVRISMTMNSSYDLDHVILLGATVQVTALSNVEAKKRFEFLEAVSGTMDAHLRYFIQVFGILYFFNLFLLLL